MKYIKPNFYDDFHCLAAACSDTCCAGWEIDIDPDTEAYYMEMPGQLGERLREHMERLPEGGACFRLTDGDRCPFLTEDNLCELMFELGEDGLCEICHEHPRFYEQIGDHMEMGIGLCCEEGARLLFEQKEPISFITTSVVGPPGDVEEPPIFRERDAAFRIVQDRSLPLRVRMYRLLDFGASIQRAEFGTPDPADSAPDPALDARETLLSVMEDMEPYDDTWPETVQLLRDGSLQAELDEIDGGFENLLVYFLYRHFAPGVTDGRLSARVKFCAVSVWFICLMNAHVLRDTGDFTEWDRIVCTKDYTKQVEYSDENLELMLAALHSEPALSTENLKRLFG